MNSTQVLMLSKYQMILLEKIVKEEVEIYEKDKNAPSRYTLPEQMQLRAILHEIWTQQ